MARRTPRPAAEALRSVLDAAAPQTPLAAVQAVWSDAVGAGIAAEAEPVAEHEGTVTVRCESSTWAAELDLMQEALLERLRDRLGDAAPRGLRFNSRGQEGDSSRPT